MLDAYVSRLLFENLSSKLPSPQRDIVYNGPDTGTLDMNIKVELYLGSKVVAQCTLIHVAMKGDITTKKWGAMTVNKPGKCIVKIDEVYHHNAHPPVSFRSNEDGVESWKKEDKLLGDMIGEDIVVNISQLIVTVDGNVTTIDTEADQILERNPVDSTQVDEVPTYGENDPDPFLTYADDIEPLFNDDEVYRSRQKEDIFHQFKNLPLMKTEPLRHMVMRLLMHATFVFHEEDFFMIEKYLQKYKNFDENDNKYLQKIMDHFYFNKEWWRSRCRMYVAKREDHAERLRRVQKTMEKDPELSKFLSPEIKQFFASFVSKALHGEFEEQDDVQLFIRSGKDSFGLPLYFRLRGTVRTENLHQKMKTAIGPWSVGARTAHMMLVLICYRYNVRTSIKRCGATDFGHSWPRHKNISHFKGKSDMISVGIGPLTYNDDHVIQSNEPDECLNGDKQFLAKQM
eukprot:15349005-Ditylum_brightwellii.AAC.1